MERIAQSTSTESGMGSVAFPERPKLLVLPEMVRMIFEFFEPLDLIRQSRVCRLWHLTAHRLLWRNHCTIRSDLLFLDWEPRSSLEDAAPTHTIRQTPFGLNGPYSKHDKVRLFQRYLPWIHSLTMKAFSDDDAGHELKRQDLMDEDSSNRTISEALHKLTNLTQLELRLCYKSSETEVWQLHQYEMLNSLIDLNPGLRNISIFDRSGFAAHNFYWVEELLRHVNLTSLEKLCLCGALSEEDFLVIFQAFGDTAFSDGDQPEHSVVDTHQKNPRLDELVMHAFDPSALHGTYLSNDLFPMDSQEDREQRLTNIGIRSLALLGFRTHYVPALDRSRSEPHNDILLRVLARCPNLESLVISPGNTSLRWPSPDLYKDRIYDFFLDKVEDLKFMAEELYAFELTLSPEEQRAIGLQDEFTHRERENFGPVFALSCPKLKSVEFGGQWHITANAWESMLTMFGQRSSRCHQDINSMNFWGATNLSSVALRILVLGGCTLTTLDISGCPHASEFAWAPLWNLPLLKHYRALGVPILAEKLVYWGEGTRLIDGYVGREHWACERLESLAIWIAVPMSCDEGEFRYDRKTDLWKIRKRAKNSFRNLYKELLKIRKRHERRRSRVSSQINSESKPNSDNEKDAMLLRRRMHDEFRRIIRSEIGLENTPRRTQVQAIKATVLKRWEARRLAGGSSTYFHEEDDGDYVIVDTNCEQTSHRRSFKDQVQEMVCGQVGRLSNLRSLTLEGPAVFVYKHSLYFAKPDVEQKDTTESHPDLRYEYSTLYTCMELTLHTGLNSLLPLGTCLQRLEVYALEEKITRDRQTVRWIAHHWGGYRAKSWEQGEADVSEDWQVALPSVDGSECVKDVPRAFQELVGVRCRNTVEQLKNERGKEVSAHIRFNNLGWLRDRCPWIHVQTVDALDAHIGQFGDASTFKE